MAAHKVVVVSLHEASALPDYVLSARRMLLQYARARGYASMMLNSTLAADRNIAWSKLVAVQRAFTAGYELVAWLDSDATIPSTEFDLARFSALFEQEFIASFDPPLWKCASLCSGVFVVRKTVWSTAFLQTWLDSVDTAQAAPLRHWHPYEQGALAILLNDSTIGVRDHIAQLPYW
jgi:hypothetical protein